jgi:hypothetical protein
MLEMMSIADPTFRTLFKVNTIIVSISLITTTRKSILIKQTNKLDPLIHRIHDLPASESIATKPSGGTKSVFSFRKRRWGSSTPRQQT